MLLTYLLLYLSTSCLVHAQTTEITPFFEEVRPGPQGTWRGRSPGPSLLVTRGGFAVSSQNKLRRFRWGQELLLPELTPIAQLPGRSYRLNPAAEAKPLRHARSVRANGEGIAVHYYYGARGWEFDIEKAAGSRLPEVRLESLDAPWTLDSKGNLWLEGQEWIKRPVAYTEDAKGNRSLVGARYHLVTAQAAILEVDAYDPDRKLVIDPVLTYATYFAGTGEDTATLVEELTDGSILLAGNTRSSDLPEGVLLNPIPNPPADPANCFVARVIPAEKRIDTVSYFGTAGYTNCRVIRRDGSGRIVMTGYSDGKPGLTTADAELPAPRGFLPPWFLARISSSLRRIEYATYLEPLGADHNPLMAVGTGDFVYFGTELSAEPAAVAAVPGGFQTRIAGGNDVLLLRYDIGARRYTARTYIGGSGNETLSGIFSGADGSVTVAGVTSSTDLPLQKAVQTVGPSTNNSPNPPAYIAAVSGDLRTLAFASYLGGQSQPEGSGSAPTSITLATPTPGGAIRVTGMMPNGSIPGLTPLKPFTNSFPSTGLFSVELTPGQPQVRNGFFAGQALTEPAGAGFFVKDGRYCFLAPGSPEPLPGGAILAGSTAVQLGCLRADGILDVLTPASSFFQSIQTFAGAPSRQGGVWVLYSVYRGGFGDAIPYELKGASIQPLRPAADSDDLVLQHFDLGVPTPEVTAPVRIDALTGDQYAEAIIGATVNVTGRNFSQGMRFEVESLRFNLKATGSTSASGSYTYQTAVPPAGVYSGRLVVPLETPIVSQPFAVIVANRAPGSRPMEPATVTATAMWSDSLSTVRFTLLQPSRGAEKPSRQRLYRGNRYGSR